jgi:hypothetical protein
MNARPVPIEDETPNLNELGMYGVLAFAARNRLSDDEAFALVERHAKASLRSLVAGVYHNLQRSLVRDIEQEVDDALVIAESPRDRVSARRLLAEETFALKDGSVVHWLDATAEQHRARAAWQRELAGNCVKDAKRHEAAAAEIEAAGVTCLRDLVKKVRVRR